MYTIRTILGTTLGLTVSGVKKMPSGLNPADNSDKTSKNPDFSGTKAYEELKNIKNMSEYVKNDPRKAQTLLDAAKKRYLEISDNRKGKDELFHLTNVLAISIKAQENEQSTQSVANAAAKSPAPARVVEETKAAQKNDILAAVAKFFNSTEEVKATTKADITAERTEQGNEAQANALIRILEAKHPGIGEKIPADMQAYLKDVNMASLSRLLSVGNSALVGLKSEFGDDGSLNRKVQLMLSDIGYTADGGLGARESRGLYSFLKFYTSQNKDVQSTLDMLGKYYQGGLDATAALRQAKNIDTKKIEAGKEGSYVVDVLTDTYDGRIARPELAKQLTAYLGKSTNVETLAKFFNIEPATLPGIATYLKANPVATAKFYNTIQQGVLFAQTYNKSGNFDVFMLDKILKGTYASLESKDKNESAETKIDKKIADAISQARMTAATLGKGAAEEFLQKLDTLESNPTALGEAKKELIRLAHVGAMANIGRNANMLGAGASFDTAIDGLTLNIGLSNKGLGLAARQSLGDGKIGETTDSIWKGGAGVSGGFPAFIALDGSVSRTDKIKIFGGGGFHDIKADQFVAVISSGVSAITYSRLDNREDNIREYGRRIENALSRVAFDTTGASPIDKLKSALAAEGLESKNATQLSLFAQSIKDIFDKEQNPASRLLLLRNLGEHQTRMLLADEVSNTVDGKSFGGWSIGIGHMLGVTFPMAGLTWYDVEQSYADTKTKNLTSKSTPATAPKGSALVPTDSPAPTTIELQIAKDSTLAELLPQGTDMKKVAEFILASRGRPGFSDFQSLLVGEKESNKDNEQQAKAALLNYLTAVETGMVKGMDKYKEIAKNLQAIMSGKTENDIAVLSSINELTSGSTYSRNLGSHLGKETWKSQVESKQFNSFLTASKKITTDAWGASYFDALYTKEVFTNAKAQKAPDTNFFGSVDYAQNRGKATGMDQMTSGFQMIGKTEVTDATEKNALTAKLYAEFVQDRGEAHKNLQEQVKSMLTKIGSTRTDINQVIAELLQGKTVEGVNGQKIVVMKPAQVFKALSYIQNAPCFNSAAYLTLPTVAITTNTPQGTPETTPPEQLDVPPASTTRADNYTTQRYTVGMSGYGEKPEDTTTPPPPPGPGEDDGTPPPPNKPPKEPPVKPKPPESGTTPKPPEVTPPPKPPVTPPPAEGEF